MPPRKIDETEIAHALAELGEIYKKLKPEDKEIVLAEIALLRSKMRASVAEIVSPVSRLKTPKPDPADLISVEQASANLFLRLDKDNSIGAKHAYIHQAVRLLGEIAVCDRDAILMWGNFGPVKVGALENLLRSHGLKFGMRLSEQTWQNLIRERIALVSDLKELAIVKYRIDPVEILQTLTENENVTVPHPEIFKFLVKLVRPWNIGKKPIFLEEFAESLGREQPDVLFGDLIFSEAIAEKIPADQQRWINNILLDLNSTPEKLRELEPFFRQWINIPAPQSLPESH